MLISKNEMYYHTYSSLVNDIHNGTQFSPVWAISNKGHTARLNKPLEGLNKAENKSSDNAYCRNEILLYINTILFHENHENTRTCAQHQVRS